MGYKASVQMLRQADDLKDKLCRPCDLLEDTQIWTDQQKLQSIYQRALVLDLDYALDKKVEQDLWNVGFKSLIANLQKLAADKNNARRSDYQSLLGWSLEEASGFYLTLLQQICSAFDLDFSFRRKDSIYGQTSVANSTLPKPSSCLYICQYCLVHLGDIARYRNQRIESENYYKQAILVSPTSGHPYNQLALLTAGQGDNLSTVFYYIRGISVKNQFPASATNLINFFNIIIEKNKKLDRIQTKLSANEFVQIFLRVQGLLYQCVDLKQAEICVKTLTSTMAALVATESFDEEKLLQITTIILFQIEHLVGNCEASTGDAPKVAKDLVLELMTGCLSAYLMPVYTLKNDVTLLKYYALPSINILTSWLKSNQTVLMDQCVFVNAIQIWPSLCKMLNNVGEFFKTFNSSEYCKTPLPEDVKLQGFKPLLKATNGFDFTQKCVDRLSQQMIRIGRLIDFGHFVCGLNGNFIKTTKTEDGLQKFEPNSIQPDPTSDLLEKMKLFDVSSSMKSILKPQGSLEKARIERESLHKEPLYKPVDVHPSLKNKRPKQNVALQSIFRKIEENKQVKFIEEQKEVTAAGVAPLQPQTFSKPQQHLFSVQPVPPSSSSNYLSNTQNYYNMDQAKPMWWPSASYHAPQTQPATATSIFQTPNPMFYHQGDAYSTTLWSSSERPSNRHQPQMYQQQNPPAGYSLFNSATSWTPASLLPNRQQSGGDKQHHLGSLFSGPGPQSLAQLLAEQQSKKNDSN